MPQKRAAGVALHARAAGLLDLLDETDALVGHVVIAAEPLAVLHGVHALAQGPGQRIHRIADSQMTSELQEISRRTQLPLKKFGEVQVQGFAEAVRSEVLSPGSKFAKSYLRTLVSEIRIGAAGATMKRSNADMAGAISGWRQGNPQSGGTQVRIELARPAGIEPATWPSEGRMISTSPRSPGWVAHSRPRLCGHRGRARSAWGASL